MEPHPVPQDISSFQFHLVGDMTLKQFGYLASGLTAAYLTFIIFGEKFPYFAWPFILIFAGLGAAFAFIPISERPLDHWVVAFFKAIMSPTQRSWSHATVQITDAQYASRLQSYAQTLKASEFNNQKTAPKLDINAQRSPSTQSLILQTTPHDDLFTPKTQSAPPSEASSQQPAEAPTSAPSIGTTKDLKQLVEAAKQAQEVQNKIVETEHELKLIKSEATTPGVNPTLFTQRFQLILEKLQELTKQANQISSQISTITPNRPTARVEVVSPPKQAVPQNITLTTSPNTINGIVTDTQGNYLDGVIIVAHDKEGLPVRALRSNKLGQFIATTPLPNGTYTLSLEKDSLIFDTLKIELDGQTLPLLTINAKTGGVA